MLQSSCSLEWSRWLHWYANLVNQLDMADIHWKTDVATVALARGEGNLALAERQLRSRLCSHGHSDLATLLMNDVLRMKLSSTDSARHAVQIQFQGAKLLHQSVSKQNFHSFIPPFIFSC